MIKQKLVRKYTEYHAVSFVIAEKEKLFSGTKSTMPTAINCSLLYTNTVDSPVFSVCLAHTHKYTFNDRFGTNMVPD